MVELSIQETIDELDAISEYFSEDRGAVPLSLLSAQKYLEELLDVRKILEQQTYADYVASEIEDKLQLL